jgi:hypothetical protein
MLNSDAFAYARGLIEQGRAVYDQRDAWSEHQPSAREENEFIALHGIETYAKWHLGIDEQARPGTKARYKFPYGDFRNVHRCAVLSAESRAGQYDHFDIERAAAYLHEMLERAHSSR